MAANIYHGGSVKKEQLGCGDMSVIVIKNRASKEVGSIKTDSRGRQTAYNRNNEKLGSFDPKTNITKDIKDRVVGNGNMLAHLILSAS